MPACETTFVTQCFADRVPRVVAWPALFSKLESKNLSVFFLDENQPGFSGRLKNVAAAMAAVSIRNIVMPNAMVDQPAF